MIPIHFDPITFVLVCAGFLMVCVGLKQLAEAHRILSLVKWCKERKERP